MKNIHEVLDQKEAECARLRHEIEALRIVIPLVDEKAVGDRVEVLEDREASRPSLLGERDEEHDTSIRTAEEAAEIDTGRKGPLATTLNETSWWKRQSSR